MELVISTSNLFHFHSAPPRRRSPLLPFTSSTTATTRRQPVVAFAGGREAEEKVEIRVCVNRTCSRQGSRETLSILSDIAPPGVSVASCGCLGRCGAGPNLVILPNEVLIGHCGTPARAAELLAEVLRSGGFDPRRNLEALGLRKKGEAELVEKGNPAEAEKLFSQAIDLKPSGGLHVVYKSRSAARLALGDVAGALEDAKEASRIEPDYPQAYICQGDILVGMKEWDAAEQAYSTALQKDPSLRRSKSFKARVLKLQEKLVGLYNSDS